MRLIRKTSGQIIAAINRPRNIGRGLYSGKVWDLLFSISLNELLMFTLRIFDVSISELAKRINAYR
jgi:hypothetical protein